MKNYLINNNTIVKEINNINITIVNYIKQEIMWGTKKKEILKEVKNDFKISNQEFNLYYKHCLDLIERKAWL